MINCLLAPIATRRGQGVERWTGRSSVNPETNRTTRRNPSLRVMRQCGNAFRMRTVCRADGKLCKFWFSPQSLS